MSSVQSNALGTPGVGDTAISSSLTNETGGDNRERVGGLHLASDMRDFALNTDFERIVLIRDLSQYIQRTGNQASRTPGLVLFTFQRVHIFLFCFLFVSFVFLDRVCLCSFWSLSLNLTDIPLSESIDAYWCGVCFVEAETFVTHTGD